MHRVLYGYFYSGNGEMGSNSFDIYFIHRYLYLMGTYLYSIF